LTVFGGRSFQGLDKTCISQEYPGIRRRMVPEEGFQPAPSQYARPLDYLSSNFLLLTVLCTVW
jgi:hypothetical protein